MGAIQISRVVGFGTKPPQVFLDSPVHLGTAQGCGVKFDAVFDRGVQPRHASLERRGNAWVIKDCGTAEGTWVDGRRVEGEWPLAGEVEVSLGRTGPKLKMGPVAESVPPSKTPAPPVVAGIPAESILQAGGVAPGGKWRAMWIGGGVAAGVLILGASGIFFYFRSQERPTFHQALNGPAPIFEDGQQVADIEVSAGSSAEETASAKKGAVSIPEDLRGKVEDLKSKGYQKALREFWAAKGTRSPYVRAILANEDLWLAKQLRWIEQLEKSDGVTTGQGMDFPGAFVPESFYPDAQFLGVPVGPAEVSRLVAGAVVQNPPVNSAVASLSNFAERGSQFAKRSALLHRFRSYSNAGKDEEGPEQGSPSSPHAYALLVGINGFEENSANLSGCRNDVGAQAKVLATQGIFLPENIHLMTDVRKGTRDYPSKENVVKALGGIIEKAGPKDILYIAFSTHGGMNEAGTDAALLMADMEELHGKELQRILSQAKAKNVVIAMDACHTGGMPGIGAAQFSGKAKRAASLPESFYEMLGQSRGHVVIRACRADQTTPDVNTLGHGILTAMMVAGMTGDADANQDGIVTLSELRIYLTTTIPVISKNADGEALEPTFTSGAFGEAGDLPLTVVETEQAPNEDEIKKKVKRL